MRIKKPSPVTTTVRLGSVATLRRENLTECPKVLICSELASRIVRTYERDRSEPAPADDGDSVIVSDAGQVWRRIPHEPYRLEWGQQLDG